MSFQEANGRPKFIVCIRAHAHDSEAVAGVIRVQKMDLIVGLIARKDLLHGSCCRSRVVKQSVKLEGGGLILPVVLYFQEPFEVKTNAHTLGLTIIRAIKGRKGKTREKQ